MADPFALSLTEFGLLFWTMLRRGLARMDDGEAKYRLQKWLRADDVLGDAAGDIDRALADESALAWAEKARGGS